MVEITPGMIVTDDASHVVKIQKLTDELVRIDGSAAVPWREEERKACNTFDGTYAQDPSYSQREILQLTREYEDLPESLTEEIAHRAPAGLTFAKAHGVYGWFPSGNEVEEDEDVEVSDFPRDAEGRLPGASKSWTVIVENDGEDVDALLPSTMEEAVLKAIQSITVPRGMKLSLTRGLPIGMPNTLIVIDRP